MKSAQWVSVGQTDLMTSLNLLQTSMILLMCPVLPLIVVAAAGTQQILQKLHSKDEIFHSVYIGEAFCKVQPYIPPPVTAKPAGDLVIQQNTINPLHIAISVYYLTIPI